MTSRRFQLWHMATFSLAGGMPLALVLSTMPAWLADAGISPKDIGFFGLASLPWTLKFLWAPAVDRFAPPFLGRRRGWVFTMEIALAVAIFALVLLSPTTVSPSAIIAVALAIAFLSATQDIAMDAYAVEWMRPEERGRGSALRTFFYRIGMVLAGGAAIGVAGHFGWAWVFAALAILFLPLSLIVWAASEPESEAPPVRTFREAAIGPFFAYFRREHALLVAAFILLYKFGDNLAQAQVSTFFLQDIQITKQELGYLQKTVGTISLLVGTLAAARALPALGLRRGLVIFGAVQALSGLLYAGTAWTDGDRTLMYAAITIEHAAQGMSTAALLALLMGLCDARHAAAEFALLTSFMGLGRTLAAIPSGYLVEWVGYPAFFLCATVVGLLCLLLVPSSRICAPGEPSGQVNDRDR